MTPSVEVTGATRLYRAASGGQQGYASLTREEEEATGLLSHPHEYQLPKLKHPLR